MNSTALPSITGQRGLRADVAETEHGGAVADDGDGVPLDRQVPDLLRIVRDRAGDARDAGRVRHREVLARLERHAGPNLDLAAEVGEERPVGDVHDLHSVHRMNSFDDRVEVLLVVGEHGDVADLRRPLDADEVDRAEEAAGLADGGCEPGEGAGVVLDAHADGGAE